MGVPLSSLPKDLQRQLLGQMEQKPAAAAPKRPRAVKLKSKLMRRCLCGFEIFRPDGQYPERCDGCGRKSP